MGSEFEVSTYILAPPQKDYDAWLDSEAHAAMTGCEAKVSAQVDGYIQGVNLELEPELRILQPWRTSEFEESEPDRNRW